MHELGDDFPLVWAGSGRPRRTVLLGRPELRHAPAAAAAAAERDHVQFTLQPSLSAVVSAACLDVTRGAECGVRGPGAAAAVKVCDTCNMDYLA